MRRCIDDCFFEPLENGKGWCQLFNHPTSPDDYCFKHYDVAQNKHADEKSCVVCQSDKDGMCDQISEKDET